MAVLLALASSALFGAADFTGGLASRRVPAVTVVLGSQATGLLIALVAAPLFQAGNLRGSDLLWGASAGLAGSVGLGVFYHALATTQMAVAAPATALFGAMVPVVFGLAIGERPELIAWLGVAVAVPALVLMSAGSVALRTGARRAVLLGLVAGVGFGLFGILISRTPDGAGLWPLLAARIASVGGLAGVVLATGRPLWPTAAWRPALAAGGMDMVANILFLLAVRQELLVLVVVISSLYPATTILLARTVLGERIARLHALGLGAGALGIVLIAAG